MPGQTGQDLYRKAKTRIPGGTQLLSKRPEMFLPENWPAYYSRAKGSQVWDLDGNAYHDMSYNGIAACILGAADPDVEEAVIAAVRAGSMSTLNPARGSGAGRSAVRAASLGRHGALCALRRRGDGRGGSHRPRAHRPRPGGLLRLSRLARLVSGCQPGRGSRARWTSHPWPRSRRRAARADGHGVAVSLQPRRGVGGDRRQVRQRDRRGGDGADPQSRADSRLSGASAPDLRPHRRGAGGG